jgi:hypothetical protein
MENEKNEKTVSRHHVSVRRRADLFAILVLFALPVIVYFQVAIGSATFAGFDHTGINQPLKQDAFAAIRAGHLPLWEPKIDRGLPLFAEGEAGVFYPVDSLFLLPGDFLTVYNWVLLILLGLAGAFFYWWVRRLGAGPLAAWIPAVAHQWGATVNFNKANMNILEGYILTPFLLMLLEPSRNPETGLIRDRWWIRSAGIAVVFACMIFAGQAQYVAYTWLFALLYVLLRSAFSGKGARWSTLVLTGAPFITGTVLGLGLACVQLLPQLELIPLSERGTYSLDSALYTHGLWLTPSRLFATFIFPAYHYSLDLYFSYMSTTAWVGPVAILLAGYALRSRNRGTSSRMLALLIGGLVFLYLAMGSNAPLAGQITSWGPLGSFRGHGRLAGYFALSILALASLGLDSLFMNVAKGRIRGDRWSALPPFSVEIALMAILAIPFVTHYREYLETRAALLIFAGFLVIFFIGLVSAKLAKSGIPLVVAMIIVLAAQIFGFYATTSETLLARSSWDRDRADLLYIRDNSSPDEAAYIAIRTEASARLHGRFLQSGLHALQPGIHDHVDYLGSANAGLMEGLTVCNADIPLELARWEWLMHRVLWPQIDSVNGALSQADLDLLWIFGVNWIVTENGDLEMPGFDRLTDPAWENRGTPYYIYRRQAPLRPYVVFWNWSSVPEGNEQTIREVFTGYLDSTEVDSSAFVEGSAASSSQSANQGMVIQSHRSRVVAARSGNPMEISMTVETSDKALFVLRDAWYPGWQVYVNGRKAELLRADMVFKAVMLEPGRNDVVFRYGSTYLRAGWTTSAASALVLLVMLLASAIRSKRKVNAE